VALFEECVHGGSADGQALGRFVHGEQDQHAFGGQLISAYRRLGGWERFFHSVVSVSLLFCGGRRLPHVLVVWLVVSSRRPCGAVGRWVRSARVVCPLRGVARRLAGLVRAVRRQPAW
jgi:hypothetical protein